MGVAGEQDQTVLQRAHDLVEVSLEGAEHFFDIAYLPAETVNLGVHHAVFIDAARIEYWVNVGHLRRHLVQPSPNRLQGAKRNVGDTSSQRQRKQDGKRGESKRARQLRLYFISQKHGGNSHPDVSETLPFTMLKREVKIVNSRCAVDDLNLAKEAGSGHVAIVLAPLQLRPDCARIGVHDGTTIHIGDTGVIRRFRVGQNGLQKRVESLIVLQTFLQRPLDHFRVIHIYVELAEVHLRRFAGTFLNFLGHELSPSFAFV